MAVQATQTEDILLQGAVICVSSSRKGHKVCLKNVHC